MPPRGSTAPAAKGPARCDEIEGLERFERVIEIDQNPIGRTPRSNPATYTGLFTVIRELFASVPEARARGYDAGRFSFNVKGGRCEACQGDGVIRVEMHFLPDVYVPCDVCRGRRYNRETLEIQYRGKNIHQVLDTTVEESLQPVRERAGGSRETAHADGGWTVVRTLGSERDHALRRRGAAGQAGARTGQARQPAARSTFSMSRPPGCTFTTLRSCCMCCSNCATPAIRWWSSNTIWT